MLSFGIVGAERALDLGWSGQVLFAFGNPALLEMQRNRLGPRRLLVLCLEDMVGPTGRYSGDRPGLGLIFIRSRVFVVMPRSPVIAELD